MWSFRFLEAKKNLPAKSLRLLEIRVGAGEVVEQILWHLMMINSDAAPQLKSLNLARAALPGWPLGKCLIASA